MEKQVADQRVRMTKQLLQGALLALMAKKPIGSITIKELCGAAGVGRGTFYAHYCDIYALLEEIEDEMLKEFERAMHRHSLSNVLSDESAVYSIYTDIFTMIERHADLCAIILGSSRTGAFVGKLLDVGREKCVVEWMTLYPSTDRRKVEAFYAFVSSGGIGLLNYWFATGRKETAAEMAKEVEHMVLTGIRCLETK